MTKDTPKTAEDTAATKVDPKAADAEHPRPAPRWQPEPAAEDKDDDLFNDMPV